MKNDYYRRKRTLTDNVELGSWIGLTLLACLLASWLLSKI